ncbi:hypothetical protein Tco_0291076 [Tanacetum coccineum]
MCGPFRVPTRDGDNYFTTFIDDFSRYGYALEIDARILNMVPTKNVGKTPYEIWHGRLPNCLFLGAMRFLMMFKTLLLSDKLKNLLPSSIILHDSKLAVEEAIPTNVVKQVPPKNKENNVAHAAPIIHKSSRPAHLLERYYGFQIDSEGHDLGDHYEPNTYHQAMVESGSKKWL